MEIWFIWKIMVSWFPVFVYTTSLLSSDINKYQQTYLIYFNDSRQKRLKSFLESSGVLLRTWELKLCNLTTSFMLFYFTFKLLFSLDWSKLRVWFRIKCAPRVRGHLTTPIRVWQILRMHFILRPPLFSH